MKDFAPKTLSEEELKKLKQMSPEKRAGKIRELLSRTKTRHENDDPYYKIEVEVLEIRVADGRVFLVATSAEKELEETVRGSTDSNNKKPIFIGDTWVRPFEIWGAGKVKKRFAELPYGTQTAVLKKQNGLFGEYEKNFSPKLKEHLEKVRKGEFGDNREYTKGEGR